MKEIEKKELNKIVSNILDSYNKLEEISHLDCDNLPSKEEIIEIILEFRDILYPGYFSKLPYTFASIKPALEEQIEVIYNKLYKQIHRSLRLFYEQDCGSSEKLSAIAKEKTKIIINKIPNIRKLLLTDIKAAYEGDPAAFDLSEIIFSYPGVFTITIYRIAHELHKLEIPLIPRIMSEYAHSQTGIDIHPGANIGEYFFIDHGTGVVIGETTVIGNHVKIYQGVTLGAISTRGGQSLKGKKRHPTLKDYVTVYAGASILGGDTVIGEGVVIGGNVFITKSVANKTKVLLKDVELQFIENKEDE